MIRFAKSTDEKNVSEKSRDVLDDLLMAAGIDEMTVTSTQRTPEEQARAIFTNCKKLGVDSQLKLYGPYGDAVVHVYAKLRGKPDAVIVAAMVEEIKVLGPGNVSHHCADPSKLNVIDLSAGGLTRAQQLSLEAAIRKERRIVRHFSPHTVPSDPAFHIEIAQS
jgi:hypothetical protein